MLTQFMSDTASDSYNVTVRDTQEQVETAPEQTSQIVFDVFDDYGVAPLTIASIIQYLQSSPNRLHGFLMEFHHKETMPTMSRAYKTAAALALSYFFGGLIPLIPYFIVAEDAVLTAMWWSIGVMGITLMIFGYVKTCIVIGWAGRTNVLAGVKGGLQMLLVGAAAAGAAVGLVRAIEHAGMTAA
jgi:vacuolar iron transporter family protein